MSFGFQHSILLCVECKCVFIMIVWIFRFTDLIKKKSAAIARNR